jgi:hypothetical protein
MRRQWRVLVAFFLVAAMIGFVYWGNQRGLTALCYPYVPDAYATVTVSPKQVVVKQVKPIKPYRCRPHGHFSCTAPAVGKESINAC